MYDTTDKYLWTFISQLQKHTYRIEADHAASGLTILDVEEKEDVNGS